MDERRRYELYTALEGLLDAECAAYLMGMPREIELSPTWQRWNRARIEREPSMAYRIYANFHRDIGPDAAATFFELFDPIGWRSCCLHGRGESWRAVTHPAPISSRCSSSPSVVRRPRR